MAKSESDLSTIQGVGPATRKKLEQASITTIAALQKESASSLAKKTSLSEKQASNVLAAASKVPAKKKAVKKTTKKAAKKASSKKKPAARKTSSKKTSAKKKKSKRSSSVNAKQAASAAAAAMKDIVARARDHFKTAPREHVFILHSGEELKDLFDLARALEDIADHVFAHHVNEDRHDFANWVQHVLDEHALAEDLRESRRHPQAHERVIYRHITRRVW
ncbi:MAG: helix-hairpin-helix domain-containing protein [Candidatus Woesearchaeota archaeon]